MMRKALPSDADRIAEIYNYYIENTVITFEKNLIDGEELNDYGLKIHRLDYE